MTTVSLDEEVAVLSISLYTSCKNKHSKLSDSLFNVPDFFTDLRAFQTAVEICAASEVIYYVTWTPQWT